MYVKCIFFGSSVVYVIPPDCVQQLFVKENVKKPDVATWYVRRRYPPNIPNINHKQVYERICMSVMKQVSAIQFMVRGAMAPVKRTFLLC